MRTHLLIALAVASTTPAFQVSAQTGQHHFVVPGLPGGGFGIPIESLLQRRFHAVIRQQYDFSCGSASLATLLRFHYGVRADEAIVFDGMWAHGDHKLIRSQGFSLLDMKRYLNAIGLQAEGYRVKLDRIATTGVPGIVLTTTRGYRHFVVVKGVTDSEVLVGDPAKGLIAYPRARFESIWDGLYFVVTSAQATGKRSFNHRAEWASVGRAPIGNAFGRPVEISALRVAAPVLGDF